MVTIVDNILLRRSSMEYCFEDRCKKVEVQKRNKNYGKEKMTEYER